MIYNFEALKKEYEQLIETAYVTNKPAVNAVCDKILLHKDKYLEVEKATLLPWQAIGAIHNKEASLNFKCHLANGQPLTMKTTIEPKNLGPFNSWTDGAIAALKLKDFRLKQLKIDSLDDWTMAKIMFFCESYNGFGNRSRSIDGKPLHSAYLWSSSNHYTRGGFVRDHVFDANYVIKNPGIWAVVHTLLEKENPNVVKMTWEEKADLNDLKGFHE